MPSNRQAYYVIAAGLFLLVWLAYQNSLRVPFVFDDLPAIIENPSLRHLWPPGEVLTPGLEGGLTVSGRPLINLSLAVNYWLGGRAVWGYHAVNLLIHGLSGLVLFGLLRRTFLQPGLVARFGQSSLPLAALSAALWLVHPLQTEAVTYVVQRAESLMGLCYLLTLYGFIRGTTAAGSRVWLAVSFLACLAGMGCKEVMVSAPLTVLLYDRTFIAGTFIGAWQRRRPYYLGLAGTWLLLFWLVVGNAGRGGTAGFGTAVSPWDYLLTQCAAIAQYLRLVLWPDPLVFDYGTETVKNVSLVWPQALGLLGLVTATGWALVRRPVWGFAGACFFLILAPSSSVVPVATQTIAEHRMYLPLAPVVTMVVIGLHAWLGRGSFLLVAGLVAAGVGLTHRRNADYRTEEVLWADTVTKRPGNGRAHNNLGKALFGEGRPAEAIAHYEAASRLQPGEVEPTYNLGLALAQLGHPAEAIQYYKAALRLQPGYAAAHNNLGNSLLQTGRLAEAAQHYEIAVLLKPRFAAAHSNLSNVRLAQGRVPEAIREGEAAVRFDPGYAEAHYNLGNALAQAGRLPEALAHYETALKLQPDYADVANNLGNVLVELGRLPEAITRYERALQLNPGYVDPRRNLAAVLAHLGRVPEAITHYRFLVHLNPDDLEARAELAKLESQGRP